MAEEKDGQKIAVEVKSFVGKSEVSEFHTALGQTLNYRSAMRKKQPDRTLYLAVTSEVYRDFFLIQFIQEVIAEHGLKLIVFEPSKQEIVLWKE